MGIAATFPDGQGAAGNTQMGFDCVIVPGAFVHVADAVGTPSAAGTAAANLALLRATTFNNNAGNVPAPPQICGSNNGLGIGAASVSVAAGAALAACCIGDTRC